MKDSSDAISKEKLKLSQSGFALTINLKERVDLNFLFGHEWEKFSYRSSNYVSSKREALFGAIGAKVIAIQVKDMTFSGDVKYMMTESWKNVAWQIAVGLAKKWNYFTPYFGMTFSDLEVEIPRSEMKWASQHKIGIISGFTLSSGSYFYLNFEGRFIDAYALNTSLSLRF